MFTYKVLTDSGLEVTLHKIPDIATAMAVATHLQKQYKTVQVLLNGNVIKTLENIGIK